jgi:uncharacterized protein
MRVVRRTEPAPAGFGTDIIGIPPGTDLEFDLRLEAVMEGVLVSGTVRGLALAECVRCLGEVRLPMSVPVTDLFAYPDRVVDEEDDEDEVRQVQHNLIDIEPALRDAVVLALPFQPVCRDDCPGLCSECGARLADDPDHQHQAADPRWAALTGILDGVPAGPSPTGEANDMKES